MKEQFLNGIEDCQWLRETHLKNATYKPFQSFEIVGNEDYPTMVRLFTTRNPTMQDDGQIFHFYDVGDGVLFAYESKKYVPE